jgi:signal transduction histidine kinase
VEAERAEHARLVEDLARRLVDIQEEERRRLSAELHDWTSPNLAAMRLNLEMLGADLPADAPEDLAGRLEDLQALLADTNASIRGVCAELRPAVLDYAGLYPAVDAYVRQFAERTGLEVALAGAAPEPRLPPDVESLLFRIVQEALTNCAKHARARTVEVKLEGAGGHAVLTIRDDGVGFDPAALGNGTRTPGLGLLTMKERAQFAGGRCSIESAPGQGTSITVEV